MRVVESLIILGCLRARISHGFNVLPNSHKIRSTSFFSASSRRQYIRVSADKSGLDDNEASNGGDNGRSNVVLQRDSLKSKLTSAFTALSENDQYDAVLTGLCAKILDDEVSKEQAMIALQDPISLLKEMNGRKVAASGRSLMSLIDATLQTQDVYAMTGTLSLGLKNGGITEYGNLQNELTALPSNPNAKVRLVDGSQKTRQERISDLPNVPEDDRAREVSSALLASAIVGFCATCNVLNLDGVTPVTNLLLTLIITIGVVDNFYDVIKFAIGTAMKKDDVDREEGVKLPDKSSLPLGLGSGSVTGSVIRGLTRLVSVDTERECECEAAAFFVAYSMGLPCFAFRPNALEAAVLVVESMKPSEQRDVSTASLDPLLSDVGIMKMLVWLMAPVAMESSKYAQLIVSDPREAVGLLQRLEDRAELLRTDAVWWVGDEDERADLLKWAYAESDLLLRQNKEVVRELTERLAGGAATVGDCVAVMESW